MMSRKERAGIDPERLRALFAQAPAAIVVTWGPEHVVEFINPFAARLFGREDESMFVGRALREAVPDLVDHGFIALLDQVYADGTPYTGDEVLVRTDSPPREGYVNFVYQPSHGPDGTVEGLLIHGVDVTDQVVARQRTEELTLQILAERDRLRQVLDVVPEAIMIADTTPVFVACNKAAVDILGIDAVGQPVPVDDSDAYAVFGARHLDGTLYPSLELPLERALLRGEDVRGEQLLLRHVPDGRDIPVLANAAPLHGSASEEIVGALVVFQDISAFKELDRVREEFFSSVAHDLKTPLTSVRGYAQLAHKRLADLDAPRASEIGGQLAQIDKSTTRMLGLINELVDVTRAQMGALTLDRRPVDVVALVRALVEQQQELAHHRLTFKATDPVLEARVDTPRLERVVSNLLANAIKYSQGEIVVTVQRAPAGDEAVITVRDQGIGIPADELPYIFDRFRRASNAAGHTHGTGIGLATVRQIVEQHGGQVDVESQEGLGSTFTVHLPLSA